MTIQQLEREAADFLAHLDTVNALVGRGVGIIEAWRRVLAEDERLQEAA